jgi:prevent-host-death family protein
VSTVVELSHMRYARSMAEVASRELRNDTRGVLRRVEAGEDVVITVAGQPIAVLRPIRPRPRWVRRDEFVRRFAGRQADAALTDDLAEMLPETTDDLPL